MSAPFFVPFNFQPTSIQRGSGTYTVPAGKYARVSVSLSVWCNTGVFSGVSGFVMDNDNINSVHDIWLKSGDSLQFSSSLSTSSATGPASGSLENTIYVNINGVNSVALTLRTAFSVASGGVSWDRGTQGGWVAQEFNEIT